MATHLISPTTIKGQSRIHGNLDDQYLVPIIQDIELMKLVPIIGQDKYDELIGEVDTPPMSADNIALMEYITPMLVKYAIYEVMFSVNNQINPTGNIQKDNENGSSLLPNDNYRSMHKEKGKAEFYAKRLVDYMCENNIEVFSQKTFTTSIYFNGKNNNKKTYIS